MAKDGHICSINCVELFKYVLFTYSKQILVSYNSSCSEGETTLKYEHTTQLYNWLHSTSFRISWSKFLYLHDHLAASQILKNHLLLNLMILWTLITNLQELALNRKYLTRHDPRCRSSSNVVLVVGLCTLRLLYLYKVWLNIELKKGGCPNKCGLE